MGKRKIAVLGGGAGSLFAAWKLAESDPENEKYDITVYQLGWRLGGKGASGRRMSEDGKQSADNRIEEHGLHFLFGFYDNVFEVMRSVYKDAFGDDTLWKQLFNTDHTDVAMIHFLDSAQLRWEAWPLPRPADNALEPGAAEDAGTEHDTIRLILKNVLSWLAGIALGFEGAQHFKLLGDTAIDPAFGSLDAETVRILADIEQARDVLEWPPVPAAGLDPSLPATGDNVLEPLAFFPDLGQFDIILKKFDSHLTSAFERLNRRGGAEWDKIKAYVDIIVTISRGVFIDILMQEGASWFSLDGYDFADWIERHGGQRDSPPVVGLYDAVFATYRKLSAGAILQSFLKAAFLFKGNFIYKMQNGMGDTIFAPLYLALKKRNVKFEFFRRVESLHLDDTKTRIASIDIEHQVAIGEYDPLVTLPMTFGTRKEWPCWPSEPLAGQFSADEQEKAAGREFENGWTPRTGKLETLKLVEHFDDVILGISVSALNDICPELLAADPALRNHVDTLSRFTTATQAMQIWTDEPPVQPASVVVPFSEPFDSIAEMSHLLKAEGWAAGAGPKALHYTCSALDEPAVPPGRTYTDYPKELLAAATANGREWIAKRAPVLWQNLRKPDGSFDWSSLHDPKGREGEARFEAQFVAAPMNLSDRYVIPVPMSFESRLQSNETRFLNLYLAGDWIKTALSIGCLEATAMSGIQAAYALDHERGHEAVTWARGDWLTPAPIRGKVAATLGAPVSDVAKQAAPGIYRRRDGELMAQPPYQVSFSDVFAFVVKADREKLQHLCDIQLNLGSARYTPVGDFVMFYGANINNIAMGTSLRSKEMGVWVPVIARETGEPGLFLTFSPYVWIDSATSTHVGREIFGYTKLTGEITVPDDGDGFTFAAKADALTSRGSEAKILRSPIVKIWPTKATTWHRPTSSVVDAAALADAVFKNRNFFDGKPSAGLLTGMLQGVQSVFLKQLPGAGQSIDCVYQAIIHAAIVPVFGSFAAKAIDGEWNITIPGYMEPRIVETLGLHGTLEIGSDMSQRFQMKSEGQAWLKFDGALAAGTQRWPKMGI